jgi:Holliday junction resolvase RusA-like endonuclease
MERVRVAVRSVLPSGFQATEAEVRVHIICFHTEVPPDVDNIIKPIFDGMKGVVFADDSQVRTVTSERRSLDAPQPAPTPVIATGLAVFTEMVYVLVQWEMEE